MNPMTLYRNALLTGGILIILGLNGCSVLNDAQRSVLHKITPYQVPVVQGNVVTSEALASIKNGMPRAEVMNIMGTPLLNSPFVPNRWDYVFTIKRKNQQIQENRVTILFDGDVVSKVEHSNVPTDAEFLASIKTKKVDEKELPALEVSPEALKKFEEKQPKPTPTPQQAVPKNSYPPLNASESY